MLVTVCRHDVAAVLPPLAANRTTPTVLFLGNNATGAAEIVAALGRERVLLGFPASGGIRHGDAIRYVLSPGSGLTGAIGELDGRVTPRVEGVVAAIQGAGIAAHATSEIEAFLKTHAALVLPLAFAVYAAAGDNRRLARTRDALVLGVRAVKEAIVVLRGVGVPLAPASVRWLAYVPEPFFAAVFGPALRDERAAIAIAGHANYARDEIAFLAAEFRQLIDRSGAATPNWDRLAAYLDPATPPLPDGSSSIALDWKPVYALLAALAAVLALLSALLAGRRGLCRCCRCCRR